MKVRGSDRDAAPKAVTDPRANVPEARSAYAGKRWYGPVRRRVRGAFSS
jgi:hypothetical protein